MAISSREPASSVAGRGTAATGAKSSRLQDVRTSPSAFRIARYVRPFTRLVDGHHWFAVLLDHAAVRQPSPDGDGPDVIGVVSPLCAMELSGARLGLHRRAGLVSASSAGGRGGADGSVLVCEEGAVGPLRAARAARAAGASVGDARSGT
ncbi:hypothetical protein ACFUNF_20705 [Streptomyces sp. NPDC057291]|uniref:hypothetical protein n=1 Tax=Streptomyces sp. NPDC057291 TaxID=3346087 RepID=UPI0036369102